MSVPSGSKLGNYEIVAKLGKGGMGEVYRAKDTKLDREVAIKVLPEAFAQDRERLSRFEREARILASVSHPNIAAIHGIEQDGDTVFLVLELAEGQTLRERLLSGPMSVHEALTLFHQIALALEVAHDKDIIHRDLKPENVAITPEKVVKVLDFGLAKDFKSSGTLNPQVVEEQPPTMTFQSTSPGVILGTIPYMSPEQARAQKLDRRTDIWSFGCCLWEALCGRHPFKAESASDVLAAVLQREPDWSALPPDTPPIINSLLKRCLQKEPHDRLHDIADARIEISEALAVQSMPARPGHAASAKPASLRSFAVGVGGILVGAALTYLAFSTSPRDPKVIRFDLDLPASVPFALGPGSSLAVAPDGSSVVYAVRRGDTTQLYERSLDERDPVPIQGTDGGVDPFFSPDGEWLGFFAEGEVKKLAPSGGSPITVAPAPAQRGASWSKENRIVFSPLPASELSSVDASGGAIDVLTTLDTASDEKSHRWPFVLPNGDAILFTTWSGDRFDIELLSFKRGERTTLVEHGSDGRFTPSGHLVFARNGELLAAPFDPERFTLTGPEVSVLSDLGFDPLTGAAYYAFNDDGLLVYVPASTLPVNATGTSSLLSVDREGAPTLLTQTERAFQLPRLSPDERRLVVTIGDEDETDLWIRDLVRGTMTRLSFEGNNAAGIWSPNQDKIVFSSDREGGAFNLFWKAADGSGGVTRLTTSDHPHMPTSWSPGGESLLFTEFDPTSGFDLWILDVESGRREHLLRTSFNEIGGMFSPDGRMIAYVSDESGESEVYIRTHPEGRKLQVSVGGGTEPMWSPRGSELFYRSREWISSARIETEPDFAAGSSRLLFETPYAEAEAAYANYDVTSDGRFIMVQGNRESAATQLRAVLNWFEDLNALVPPR